MLSIYADIKNQDSVKLAPLWKPIGASFLKVAESIKKQ